MEFIVIIFIFIIMFACCSYVDNNSTTEERDKTKFETIAEILEDSHEEIVDFCNSEVTRLDAKAKWRTFGASNLKESTRAIYDYIDAHDNENFTAQDIADALGIGVKSVNGTITSFQKRGMVQREEVNTIYGKIKYIRKI